MGGSQNPWEGARSRGVESESMGQVWHPIGEDENPWCGVRTCRVGVRTHGTRAEQERVRTYGVWVSTTGVRSGAVGWSRDPWDKDRPWSGLDVVAMWDMAECPSHAGAVWVLCGCCAPCLAVTRTICWRKRCLSQPTACTECRSCTGVLQHPTVFMGPAQGDAAVPTAGRWLGVSSISGLELVKGNASRARTRGRTACPHKAQKGRAPHGAQTGLTAAESHPKDPSGSFQGIR